MAEVTKKIVAMSNEQRLMDNDRGPSAPDPCAIEQRSRRGRHSSLCTLHFVSHARPCSHPLPNHTLPLSIRAKQGSFPRERTLGVAVSRCGARRKQFHKISKLTLFGFLSVGVFGHLVVLGVGS